MKAVAAAAAYLVFSQGNYSVWRKLEVMKKVIHIRKKLHIRQN